MLFGIEEKILKETNSYNTAKEILQQPNMWKKTLDIFKINKKNIENFFDKIGLNEDFKIIFTGAGTSEYIGNILVPYLNRERNLDFLSLGTTDILNNPSSYLKKNKKTLLVSFARSGDSPESVSVVNLANDMIDEIYHLFITCNKNGALSKMSENSENIFTILMPEETNDKGFAMTSSFSSMLLTGILVFSKNVEEKYSTIEKIISVSKKELEEKYTKIRDIANLDHKRIVILGSAMLGGLAQELALKIMELSAGKVVSVSNTTLGFRHGPKAIIDKETIIFNLVNEDIYAKNYDKDLIEEMYLDENRADKLVAYSIDKNENIDRFTDYYIYTNEEKVVDKILFSIFIYTIYGQMYSFFKSQYLKLPTDNPFPTGEVNRVVKKFKVYKYEEDDNNA